MAWWPPVQSDGRPTRLPPILSPQRAAHRVHELLRSVGLLDEAGEAAAHELPRGLRLRVARGEEHAHGGIETAQLLERLLSREPGHREVEEDEADLRAARAEEL